jgi:hypothetical protein
MDCVAGMNIRMTYEMAMKGTSTLTVIKYDLVRSTMGEMMADATSPTTIRTAPAIPASSSENPYGSSIGTRRLDVALKNPTKTEKGMNISQNGMLLGSSRSAARRSSLGAAAIADGGVGGAFGMNRAGRAATLEMMAVYSTTLGIPDASVAQKGPIN